MINKSKWVSVYALDRDSPLAGSQFDRRKVSFQSNILQASTLVLLWSE